jgi:hypothetical protein
MSLPPTVARSRTPGKTAGKASNTPGKEPTTYPLTAITVTWPALNDFAGQAEEGPIRLSGTRLGAVLGWMARTTPGSLSLEETWDTTGARLDLEGLEEILRGLSEAPLEIIPARLPAIFRLLANVAGDIAGRLGAMEDIEHDLAKAVVTIAPAPEAAR